MSILRRITEFVPTGAGTTTRLIERFEKLDEVLDEEDRNIRSSFSSPLLSNTDDLPRTNMIRHPLTPGSISTLSSNQIETVFGRNHTESN